MEWSLAILADKVAVITDSTACIPPAMAKKYGIEIVPVVFIFGDKSYLDGVDMSTAEFYERLRRSDKLPTTSGSQPGSYLDAYHRASQRASGILCITVPSGLSGMFNSAEMAMKMAKETMPGITIEVLDCGTAAAAQGLVVLEAARAAALGKNLTEVINHTRSIMQRVNLLATLDTLNYLVKGGRVPKAAALATSLLQIKPIFTVKDGEARPLTNARTMPGALNQIIKMMKEKVVPGKPLHVAIMHADARESAEKLAKEISNRFVCAELFFTEFTPVMGVHTGPGVVGVAFYSE
jgi:DegV family protein with EDD domain